MNETEVRKAILNRLMFAPSLSYGELHKDFANLHDLFNYHLKELVLKGFVSKEDSIYALTATGRQQVSLMEEDGQLQKQFKVGMFIDLLRFEQGKWQMLLHRRKKHPHYDYIGAVTGKLRWGDSLKNNLERELHEELNIIPEQYCIAGVHREIFKDEQGNTVGDGVFYVIFVTQWKGTPIEKNIEGEYFWHNIDEILSLDNIFRKGFEVGIPHIKRYLENPDAFTQYLIENGEDKLNF